ncbi:UNVERIFIED_CONTAM: hypothetical protein GTU68_039196, partial [Idotea baltica]|nr:hypothetical protein [Idotea baltica]
CDVEIYPVALPIPRDELLKRIQGKNGLFCLITEKIDKELLDAAGPSLKVVSTFSVGYDHIDLDEVKTRKIKVGYTPGVPTDASAELTVALLLAAGRRLFEANAELLNGGWGKCAWSPLWMTGFGLANSTVGIFGLGRIGLGVLQRLKGFNVARFIYNSRSKKKEGRDVFNAEAFAKMKSSAILVNTARGGIVDQDALIAALKGGQIRAAGLDAMIPEPLPLDHPLITTPNLSECLYKCYANNLLLLFLRIAYGYCRVKQFIMDSEPLLPIYKK